MLYNSVCLEKYKEKVGHRACSGDMMGQTHPIYACTGINDAHQSIISSRYI